MTDESFDQDAAIKLLNQIMEAELAGVVRYTHYSLMVFGHSRIPIVSWLRGEANTCLAHANAAGELVVFVCSSVRRPSHVPGGGTDFIQVWLRPKPRYVIGVICG